MGLIRKTTTASKSMRGVALIEVALILPLFLIILLIFLWLSARMNAQATLDTALAQGVRLGITRGNSSTLGLPLLPVVDQWLKDKDENAALKDALCFNLPDDTFSSCLKEYDGCTVQQLYTDGTALSDLAPEYAYSLVYINEAVRQSLGNLVKFPCSPSEDFCSYSKANLVSPQGAGCFLCRFLDGNQNAPIVPPTRVDYNNLSLKGRGFRDSKIAVECKYQMSSVLTAPLNGLLGVISPQANIVSGTAEITADSLASPDTYF